MYSETYVEFYICIYLGKSLQQKAGPQPFFVTTNISFTTDNAQHC